MPANEVPNALVASLIIAGGAIVRTFGLSAAAIDGGTNVITFTVSDQVGRPGSAELVVQGSAAAASGLDAALMVRDLGAGNFEAVCFEGANIVPDVASLNIWRVRTGS